MTRALLIGGSGQLGTEIRRRWEGWTIAAPSHEELDLADAGAVAAAIAAESPDVVVNCAAFHNVDRCEEVPEEAFAVNALAVERVARLCRDRGPLFVTVSTDYVFDGNARRPYTENDPPHPLSAYGISKLAGELLVERLESRALVVRTCGVYGLRPSRSKGHTFVDRIVSQARAGEKIRVVSDVVASPTFAGHLATGMRQAIEAGALGLVHIVNAGAASWYEFACEALRRAGIAHPIEPISAGEWKAGARRPAYSALENARLRTLGIGMPAWQEGVAEYVSLRVAAP